MLGDLVTLAAAKDWLGITGVLSDQTLTRLITSASRFILSDINRQDLTYHQVNEIRDGTGTNTMVLQEYPALSIISLTVGGQLLQPSTSFPPNGYIFDPWSGQDTSAIQRIKLGGAGTYLGPGGFTNGYGAYGSLGGGCGGFPREPGSVQIVYMAGYYVPSEAFTAPAGAPFTYQTYRLFAEDEGLAYSNGTPLIRQANANDLTIGQYYPDPLTGLYNLSPADAGAALVASYSYTPEDLNQACLELVGERFRIRGRIGIVTQTLGGQETTTYSQRDMNPFISALLAPYRKTVPL